MKNYLRFYTGEGMNLLKALHKKMKNPLKFFTTEYSLENHFVSLEFRLQRNSLEFRLQKEPGRHFDHSEEPLKNHFF